jgi:O-6-methylguanine DNA methyltransferase
MRTRPGTVRMHRGPEHRGSLAPPMVKSASKKAARVKAADAAAVHDEVAASEPRPEVLGCAPLAVPAIDAVLWLAWTRKGLCVAHWGTPGSARPAAIATHVPERPIPTEYESTLSRYFAGEKVDPVALPVDLQGTAFQLRVWQALRNVPRGSVRSYAGIALDIGQPRGMRAVGMANGRNPVAVVVPCHRVIEKGAGLGGYTGGLHFKRFLLALEGVDVARDTVRAGQLPLI